MAAIQKSSLIRSSTFDLVAINNQLSELLCVKFGKDADPKYFYTKHLKLLCSQSDLCGVSEVLDKRLPMKRSEFGA